MIHDLIWSGGSDKKTHAPIAEKVVETEDPSPGAAVKSPDGRDESGDHLNSTPCAMLHISHSYHGHIIFLILSPNNL
jgi:hypothetical protein